MARRYRREPKDRDMLQVCFETARRHVEEQKLPGADSVATDNDDIIDWIAEHEHRVNVAIRDEDEPLFEKSLASWMRAWERINELVAEEYREQHPDPEEWELRYVKWMKLTYIKFESEKFGVFYVVPRRPRRKPRATYWFTADEMIDMMHPTIVATIKAFGAMPIRPEQLRGPTGDEKHLTVDFTKGDPVIAYTVPGGPKYDRERFRRRPAEDSEEIPSSGSDSTV